MEAWHPIVRVGVKALGSAALAATLGGITYAAVQPALHAQDDDGKVGDDAQILHTSRQAVNAAGIQNHPALFHALQTFSQFCGLGDHADQAKILLRRLVMLSCQLLHQSAALHKAQSLKDVLTVQNNLGRLNVKIDRAQMRLQGKLMPLVGREKLMGPAGKIGQFVANFIAREMTVAGDMRSMFLKNPHSLLDMGAEERQSRRSSSTPAKINVGALVTSERLTQMFGDTEVVVLGKRLAEVLALVEAHKAAAAPTAEAEMQGHGLQHHALLTRVAKWFQKLQASQSGGLSDDARQRLRIKLSRAIRRLARELVSTSAEGHPSFHQLLDAVTTFEALPAAPTRSSRST